MGDVVFWIALVLVILLILLLLLLLLGRRLNSESQGTSGSGPGQYGDDGADGTSGNGSDGSGDDEFQHWMDEERRRELAQKVQLVQSVAKDGDQLLAQCLLKQAGQQHCDLKDVSADRSLAERIARSLSLDELQMLSTAASQQDIKFDLQTKMVDVNSPYPTKDVEVEKMMSLDDMASLPPETLCLDEEAFYNGLVQNSHMMLKYHDREVDQPHLYILSDVSGSMQAVMENGVQRHTWARGIEINLLLKAVRGNACYRLRFFDSKPFKLQKADTVEEAQRLLDLVANRGLSEGGTDLWNAVSRAIRDIRSGDQDFKNFDVLLITDGEDSSMDNTAVVKEALGNDIRLHVIIIGHDSPALERVATTYKVFH